MESFRTIMQTWITAGFPQFCARTFKHHLFCRHVLLVLIAQDPTSRWKPSKIHFVSCWICCSLKLHFIMTRPHSLILNFRFVIRLCPKSQPSRPEGWRVGGVNENLAEYVLSHFESAFFSTRVWTIHTFRKRHPSGLKSQVATCPPDCLRSKLVDSRRALSL